MIKREEPVQGYRLTISGRSVGILARMIWPALLEELPMFDAHKELLRKHWAALPEEFRIESSRTLFTGLTT